MDATRSVILLSSRSDTSEMEELLRSLGYHIESRVIQQRSRPDPETFLGQGKLLELARSLREGSPPMASGPSRLVVVDAALKPPQLFGIEDVVRLEAWDRIRVILEIFQQKAQVKEARLQVELARLRYELPFVHEALHRTLTGEHPGFMGGGELPMRTYETHLKRRTRKIQDELAGIRQERAHRREGRRRSGFRLVAIAGYTNSGKSSLLNALCGSEATVENRYFSTLQTTTRRLRPERVHGRHTDLLFTDTVGFIRDLPPWLIDAFSSTLEEVALSDVVVLVVDASEALPLIRDKLRTAWELLDRLEAPKRRFILLNKSDLLPSSSSSFPDTDNHLSLEGLYPSADILWTSTKTGKGLEELVNRLIGETMSVHEVTISLNPLLSAHVSFESWLRDHTDVQTEARAGELRRLVLTCSEEHYPQLRRRAKAAKVTLEERSSTGKKGGSPPALAA